MKRSENSLEEYLRATKRLGDIRRTTPLNETLFHAYHTKCSLLFRRLLRGVDSKEPEAWYTIGCAYRHGWVPPKDIVAAKAWFTRAAEAGHSQAMIRIGLMIPQPPSDSEQAEAIAWFEKAAALGNPSGMIQLGFARREGQGLEKDYHKACEHFIAAYEAGDHHAAVYAGKVLAFQLKKPEEGLHWLLKAADQSKSDAPVHIADLYGDRSLSTYNATQAVSWYESIAKSPKPGGYGRRAMLALAHHYRDGEGVVANKETAVEWLNRFDEMPHPSREQVKEAADLRHELENNLL